MKVSVFRLARQLLVLLAACAAPKAYAVGTTAGTLINNQAAVEYTIAALPPVTALSNIVSLRVDEILDVSVSRNDASDLPVTTSATAQPLAFRVTNNGNGTEAFRLNGTFNLTGDQFDPVAIRIALDSNGNGIYDPSVDQLYVAGQNDLLLNPDQSAIVFILGDMPASFQNGDKAFVDLAATSTTGTGAPGTVFAQAGDGGSDAVVGSTRARANDQSTYFATLTNTEFVKSQAVLDPYGGTTPIPGSVITYSLTVRVSGSGQVQNAVIADPIPAQTTYVTGSLRLNGAALTDTADADAGQINNGAVQVALGTLTAPATQTVTFQVKLN